VVLAGSGPGYTAYLAAFIIAGVGVSMAIPAIPAAALNAVDPPALGKASAILSTLRQFGAVFGIAIATAIFNSSGSLAGPAAAGFSVIGALAAMAVRRARRPADAQAFPAPSAAASQPSSDPAGALPAPRAK
jgi:hypothetical protein